MGVQALAKDLGRAVPIRLHIDSSAALSIIKQNRTGQSEAHRDPALVRDNKLTVEKIPSETNSSDRSTSRAGDRKC